MLHIRNYIGIIFPILASCQFYEQQIQCYDGSLLPAASRCNNYPECSQGEDEYGCPENSKTNLVKLPEEHQQKIFVNSYPDYQNYQDYQEYQQQPGNTFFLKIIKGVFDSTLLYQTPIFPLKT